MSNLFVLKYFILNLISYSCFRCLVSKLFDVCPRSTMADMDLREEVRVAWGTGIAGFVAESGEPVNIPDAYQVSYQTCTQRKQNSSLLEWILKRGWVKKNSISVCDISWTLSVDELQGRSQLSWLFPWNIELIDWYKGKSLKSVESLSNEEKKENMFEWWSLERHQWELFIGWWDERTRREIKLQI